MPAFKFRYKECIMKCFRSILVLMLLAGSVASSSAWAYGGHGGGGFHGGFHGGYHGGFYHGGPRVGIVIGGPGYWGYPDAYDYPPYAYPPVVVAPSAPPTYIEQGEPAEQAPAAQQSNDWYYCSKPEGYYPYVKQCPGGWQRVAPQPPSPQP
jgi:hypothetical protein